MRMSTNGLVASQLGRLQGGRAHAKVWAKLPRSRFVPYRRGWHPTLRMTS
jgi:hypothetical protein